MLAQAAATYGLLIKRSSKCACSGGSEKGLSTTSRSATDLLLAGPLALPSTGRHEPTVVTKGEEVAAMSDPLQSALAKN